MRLSFLPYRLMNRLFSKRTPKPLSTVMPQLEEWLQSTWGQALLQHEQKVLDGVLAHFFGFHLLQLSIQRQQTLYDACVIQHKFCLSPIGFSRRADATVTESLACVSALAEFDELPFENESIDVVILHHVLDFSPNPHQLLREASRVLVPHGHLVVVNFNPFSILGVWRFLSRSVLGAHQWGYHSLTSWRMRDWFKLLDFTPLPFCYGMYTLPSRRRLRAVKTNEKIEALGERHRWPFGSFYVAVGRKDVMPMTRNRSSWRFAKPAAIRFPVATPATKNPAMESIE